MDARVGGSTATAYHRTNGMLHALAATLVLLWLRSRGLSDNAALAGGLVFAVHPTLTQAVAWIPGRPDLMMTVFGLLAWIFYSRTVRTGDRISQLGHHATWLLAFLSKEGAIVLPIVWILEARILRRRPIRSCIEPWMAWGWGIAFSLYVCARVSAVHSVAGGSGLGLSGITLAGVLGNTPVVLSSLGKLVLPLKLSVLAIPEDTLMWPGLLAVAALAALAWRLPATRTVMLFSVLGYTTLMLPSLPATSLLVLECRLYLPAVPLVLLVCSVAETATASRHVRWASTTVALSVFGFCAHSYLDSFRDRPTFAEAAARQSPHSALAHKNLGIIYHLAGRRDQAEEEYVAALALDASEPIAHNNLGVIFMAKGKLLDAERELRNELDINPGYGDAHHNLAIVLRATGRNEEAATHWQASLDGSPNDAEALSALAAYLRARDPARAEQYNRTLQRMRVHRQ